MLVSRQCNNRKEGACRALEPESQANNVTALKGREGIRLRVGDWRVIMNDDGVVLAVLDIVPRGSLYE